MNKTLLALLLASLNTISFAQSSSDKNIFSEFSNLKKTVVLEQNYKEKIKALVLNSFLPDVLKQTSFDTSISQYFIVVDAANNSQNLILAFWDSQKNSFELNTTSSKVSTGVKGQFEHFITPIGWVEQKTENGTYRAEGSKNQNGIRGYGAKGMRVWDFGWQHAYTGWLKNNELRDIRMQMHATDPDYLESKLGTPRSKGCVRISAETNKFIDSYGLIDRNIEKDNPNHFVLKHKRNTVKEEGSFVLVINSQI
jgi:lipoprotein-anchoring transpeptidase ErfK/SrfK